MSLEIRTIEVDLTKESSSLTYLQDVKAYVSALSGFHLEYHDKDHHVKECKISVNMSNSNSKTIDVDYSAVLKDNSNHSLDKKKSWLRISVIAWIGSDSEDTLTLVNRNNIESEGRGVNVQLPSGTTHILKPFLSGFDVAYNGDHHVHKFWANAYVAKSGTTAQLTTKVGMEDSSRNSTKNASGNVGLIATYIADPGFEIKQGINDRIISFSKNVKKATIVITHINVEYLGGDHHVGQFFVKELHPMRVEGNTVQCNVVAGMVDNTHHHATGTATYYILAELE